MRIEIPADAERQFATVLAWWRAERSSAPGLLARELAWCEALLTRFPSAGWAWRRKDGAVI